MKYIGIICALLAAVCLADCSKSGKEEKSGSENIETSEAISENGFISKTQANSTPKIPIKQGPRYNDRVPTLFKGSLKETFNDSNYIQYSYAERLGISPIESLYDAYFTSRPIVKVESGKNYEVDELTHSVPYLIPQAARLLEDIGAAFIDTLENRGADGYKIMVTSLLRTPGTVKRLRRVNRNATDSSTHKFGTTFDISWSRFHCADSTRTLNDADLKNILAEVLLDKRKEGRCLVKYEQKTACFHITAIK